MQVWVEVQHCEERVQLLCTITRAVETHVSILQDEVCKVNLTLSSLNTPNPDATLHTCSDMAHTQGRVAMAGITLLHLHCLEQVRNTRPGIRSLYADSAEN